MLQYFKVQHPDFCNKFASGWVGRGSNTYTDTCIYKERQRPREKKRERQNVTIGNSI